MVRAFTIFLVMLFFALPAVAEQEPLSPQEVEALPFDRSLAATPNAETIYEQIDTHGDYGSDGHAKSDAGLPQFDTSTFASQIFWLGVTFIILYFYFSRVALPRLSATIEQRHATIKGDLEQADKLSQKIEDTRTQYESAIKDAHDNARATITSMEQAIRQEAEEQSRTFAKTSAVAVADLENRANLAKQKIKTDLNDIAKTLTHDIITKLSSLSVKDDEINKAVSDNSDFPANSNEKKAA